jgi:SAM-dependent methyltransferase
VPAGGTVLDLACGGGRHTRFFLGLGHPVVAVDRDVSGVQGCGAEVIEADLEADLPFPLAGRQFGGVVVTNYLHRPLLHPLLTMIANGGVLIYETFAAGNERFGRPRRPDFLLQPNELLRAVRAGFRVVSYEDVTVDEPRPAAVQRICAVRTGVDSIG